jgi:hypothetical protein
MIEHYPYENVYYIMHAFNNSEIKGIVNHNYIIIMESSCRNCLKCLTHFRNKLSSFLLDCLIVRHQNVTMKRKLASPLEIKSHPPNTSSDRLEVNLEDGGRLFLRKSSRILPGYTELPLRGRRSQPFQILRAQSCRSGHCRERRKRKEIMKRRTG